MRDPQRLLADTLITGVIADAAALPVVALLGARDSGSAIGPLHAATQVVSPQAGKLQQASLRYTPLGLGINIGAGLWWALVLQLLFGRMTRRGGAGNAMLAGAATAALAYIADYKLLPRRLTPGWEHHMSWRSVSISLATLGLGLGAGAYVARQWHANRRPSTAPERMA